MSKIGTTEVERIATLAHIGLSPEETARMAVELGQIMEFVEQLSTVNIDDVAPTDQVTGLINVMREDIVRPSMPREQLLANAPDQKDGYIIVPRVL